MQQNNIDTTLRQSVRDILQRAKERNQAGVRVRVTRARNKNVDGKPFSGLEKVAVWLNAKPIDGKDARLWRQDACGATMYWHDYAKTTSAWGWEVDHVTPISYGGTDDLSNLQALHWRNNRHKGEGTGSNYCIVPARCNDLPRL